MNIGIDVAFLVIILVILVIFEWQHRKRKQKGRSGTHEMLLVIFFLSISLTLVNKFGFLGFIIILVGLALLTVLIFLSYLPGVRNFVEETLIRMGLPTHEQAIDPPVIEGDGTITTVHKCGRPATRFHCHNMMEIPWNEKELGPSIYEVGSSVIDPYARFLFLYECVFCGKQIIVSILGRI
jgi:hypothetical protein